MSEIKKLTEKLLEFRDVRDWSQFHNPKDLAIALNVESGELLECFLWMKAEEADKDRVKEELADIIAFTLLLADKYDFDVAQIVLDKIASNNIKYPVDKAKGNAKKYNEL